MADSKLGTLAARVVLNRGRGIHYGTEDTITGMVVVSYLPYKSFFKKNVTTADYFGPLKLEVTLTGKIRVKIKRSRDTVISSDYGTPLFSGSFEVFDGSFKAEVDEKYEFPFAVQFPSVLGDSPTPISFRAWFSDYPDRVDAAVLYRIGAKLDTPGIKVDLSPPDFDPEPEVRLDLPRPDQSMLGLPGSTLQTKIVVQNKQLLPEAERPSGVKQSLKAVFSSTTYPKFVANITCTSIDRACPGLRPRFLLAIHAVNGESTTQGFPEVTLEKFKATLTAHTQVDTSERILASSSCFDSFTAQKLSLLREGPTLPASLSKANEHTIELEMEPFGTHSSSFEHPKISRRYVLEILAVFKIAGTAISFLKQFPIEILPPPACSDVAPPYISKPGPSRVPTVTVEAGPSRVAADEEFHQPPPAYVAP